MKPETEERVKLAAQLKLAGYNQRQSARQLFPHATFEISYSRTRSFFRDHLTEIESEFIRQKAQASKPAPETPS
jgi:hypothetical protein